MAKLIMCIGLQGSGKSFWAARQDAIVVNKDSIRAILETQGWVWSREAEKDVIAQRDKLIIGALKEGKDVISSDTNLAPKHQNRLKQLATQNHAKFEIKDFRGVPIEVCIERDSKREGKDQVGRDVIVKMAVQFLNYTPPVPKFAPYVRQDGLPEAIICDLDGTLCNHNGRSPFDYDKCDTDTINLAVDAVLEGINLQGVEIIFMSGREATPICKAKTEQWLMDHGWGNRKLFMRTQGDYRKDNVIKGLLFDTHIRDKFNILFCLDDRSQVVKFYRELGLTVLQVAEGNF